jgi:hypothetical protein
MGIYRATKQVLIFVMALFLASCGFISGQPLAPAESSPPNSLNANLVVVATTQDSGKTFITFHCLGRQDCYAPIPLPADMELLDPVNLPQDGTLLIPIRNRIEDKANSVGFLQVTQTDQKLTTTALPDFTWSAEISQIIFLKNRMIFTIGGDNRVYILDESGNVKEIPFADMDPDMSHYRIIKGNNEKIIIVGGSLRKQDDKKLIGVSILDLQNYTVETESIPWPETVVFSPDSKHETGKRYNAQIDGITSDKKTLYYQFFGLDDKMTFTKQLGVYNTQAGDDRNYPSAGCIGLLPFSEYKGYLYKNGQKSDLGVSDKPVILDLSDFRSIVDFKELEANPKVVRIVPFGNSFLIGLDQKIVQVDFSGKILQEFSVPSELVGRDYILARFEN